MNQISRLITEAERVRERLGASTLDEAIAILQKRRLQNPVITECISTKRARDYETEIK